ncbi:diguanylate cyclase [Sulfuricurvum sp.]|uniref:sensor domain-containing diguanylate cyclase n=1 Tax=Sulfuricurvum sp. TaxID=2025608 RepID=UPI002E338CA0|nr:diguanylate cyclase [Sulfuricurvum sp.]HEX5329777.1 diguanylate cyclase [Sulfuricurvum sp.]
MTQKNFKLIFTLYFIIFGIVITLFSSFIGYNIQMINIKDRIDKNAEEISYIRKINMLKPDIDKMGSILIALKTDKALDTYLKTPNNTNKAHSQNVFYAIALSDHLIMQARFIDATGKEQIRIDRTNSSALPFIVDDAKLQDKSGRDYFQIVSKMKHDTIWYSKIDLNIEHGKIEVPYRPTYRIATPIYRDGVFKGIVIVNMLMDEVISKISKSTVFDHYIIDKEGHFILHSDERFSWSKYTHSNIRLVDVFPLEASAILAGQSKGESFYAYSLDDILHNGEGVRLILKPKQEYIDALLRSNIKVSLLVILLSILLSIPLAMYASLAPSKLQKALVASNNDLKRFADIIDQYVVTATTKTNSIITAVSTAYAKLSGYSKAELIGQKVNILKHPSTPKEMYQELWDTIERGEEWKGELHNKHKNGESYWIEQTIIPIKDEHNTPLYYMSVGIDITAKKELEILSMMDRLTGIANRRKLDEFLAQEAEQAKRYDRPLSLLMIDIDHFKEVNDTYGHQIGDYTLQSVAMLLKENIRLSDFVGRFGGEEFMVICPETNHTSASTLAEKLRLSIDQHPFETIRHTTISIGIAQLHPDESVSDWVDRADKALYLAKHGGRNRVC